MNPVSSRYKPSPAPIWLDGRYWLGAILAGVALWIGSCVYGRHNAPTAAQGQTKATSAIAKTSSTAVYMDEEMPYYVIRANVASGTTDDFIVVNRKSRKISVFTEEKNAPSGYRSYRRLDQSSLEDFAKGNAQKNAQELVDKANIEYLEHYENPKDVERAEIEYLIAKNRDKTTLDLNSDGIQDCFLFDSYNKYSKPFLFLGSNKNNLTYIEDVKMKRQQSKELGGKAKTSFEDIILEIYQKKPPKPKR